MTAAVPLSRRLRLVVVSQGGGGEPAAIEKLAERAFAGGATAFWVRERSLGGDELAALVRAVRRAAAASAGLVIVSGRADLVGPAAAHAVQLGSPDAPAATVRAALQRLPQGGLLGVSAHDPLDEPALRAADYAILAPLHDVPGKGPALGVARFRELRARIGVPVVALGGIDASRAGAAIAAGADGVAVLRAVCDAADPTDATRALRAAVERALAPG